MSIRVVFFFLLLITKTGYCQFFGQLLKNPEQYYTWLLREPRDGKYRVTVSKYEENKKWQIHIFNQSLQLIDSITFLNGMYPATAEPLRINNDFYWPMIIVDTTGNWLDQKLAIAKFDLNYQYITNYNLTNFQSSSITTSNLIFINGRFYISKSGVLSGPTTLFKLDSQFGIVDTVSYPISWITEIHPSNNKIMIRGKNMPTPCIGSGPGGKMVIDTAFTFESCFPTISFGVTSIYGKVIPISNKKFLAAGFNTDGGPNATIEQIVNVIFDDNNNIVSTKTYSSAVDNVRYNDGYNYVAIEQGTIMTVGCIGFTESFQLAQSRKNTMLINKFDSTGTIIWEKQVGGDMFYRPRAIIFTNDGGCLISGLRYDSTNPIFQNGMMQSFLLKLNANGEYLDVGINENEIYQQPIKCFPNPSNDKIYFDVPFRDEFEITIYSPLGLEILKFYNYQNLFAFDVSTFESGIYFYKIRANANSYSGKFIKN